MPEREIKEGRTSRGFAPLAFEPYPDFDPELAIELARFLVPSQGPFAERLASAMAAPRKLMCLGKELVDALCVRWHLTC
ncbi:MAG: hypothetical protein ACREK3_08120, partial [Gemmatimonadota bacterium]